MSLTVLPCISQELGAKWHFLSEYIFVCLFTLFFLWTFSPFVRQHKRFYTAVLWARILVVLSGEKSLGFLTSAASLLGHCKIHMLESVKAEAPCPSPLCNSLLLVDLSSEAHACPAIFAPCHQFIVLDLLLFFSPGGAPCMLRVCVPCTITCWHSSGRSGFPADVHALFPR